MREFQVLLLSKNLCGCQEQERAVRGSNMLLQLSYMHHRDILLREFEFPRFNGPINLRRSRFQCLDFLFLLCLSSFDRALLWPFPGLRDLERRRKSFPRLWRSLEGERDLKRSTVLSHFLPNSQNM